MSVSSWSQSLSGLLPRVGESLGRLLPPVSIRIGWANRQQQPSSSEADSGTVLAVPKKKTSHQKKRQRQLTGRKQINPLNNLNRCPACGHYKRAHTLCMRCVSQIQRLWKARDDAGRIDPAEQYQQKDLHPVDKQILYPGRHVKESEKLLKKKDYLYTRPRTLPVEPKNKTPKISLPRK